MSHRTLGIVAAAAVTTVMTFGFVATAHADLNRVSIGTNPAGTTYNTLGGAFAKIIQEKLNVQSTARPFSGSSVYLPMLQRGEITLGINSSFDSAVAYRGMEPYPAAMDKVRALMTVWNLPYGIWTKKSSGIEKVADLKGKRVVITFRGNAALERIDKAILATAGLTVDDVTPLTVAGIPESLRMVAEGRADASPIALGVPALRQTAAGISEGIRIIDIGPDEAKLPEMMPGVWATTTEPSPVNVGVDKPTRIAMFSVYINTGTHLVEEDAYTLVKTIYDNWGSLQKDYPVLRGKKQNDMAPSNNAHPFHPGAIKFWKEAGLWTDAHEAQQKKVLGGDKM